MSSIRDLTKNLKAETDLPLNASGWMFQIEFDNEGKDDTEIFEINVDESFFERGELPELEIAWDMYCRNNALPKNCVRKLSYINTGFCASCSW